MEKNKFIAKLIKLSETKKKQFLINLIFQSKEDRSSKKKSE